MSFCGTSYIPYMGQSGNRDNRLVLGDTLQDNPDALLRRDAQLLILNANLCAQALIAHSNEDRDVRTGYSHFIEQQLPCRAQYYRNTAYLNSNRAKDIIQCHEMVKVACVLKGVVRAIKADQRFFNSITAG